MGKYDDIINLKRPISKNHAPMPMENRAAQFMPFAALTGYDDKISDAGKTFEENILKAEHPEEEFHEC